MPQRVSEWPAPVPTLTTVERPGEVARRVPRHIAFIMDGNGRWAQGRGRPRLFGHRAGADALRRTVEACARAGIEIVTAYAFSTENWGRSEDEVNGLLRLLAEGLVREIPVLQKNGIQLRHIGTLDRVPERTARRVREVVALTRTNSRLILNVAFNYGGRAEIVDAVKQIVRDGVPAEEIDEALVSRYLYTAGLPDPDLIVRTAGEMRISNFLLWQASYAEYYCTPTYWPDFGEAELQRSLEAFRGRERRFGGVTHGASEGESGAPRLAGPIGATVVDAPRRQPLSVG